MKKILTLLFIMLGLEASATTYYVSSAGNDAATGLSESSPWLSVAKVNSAFPSMKPGDRILFRCGDTFNGTLKITASGLPGNPIVIGSYGSGPKPLITGFTALTSWTSEGNGIYSKAVSCASSPNFITINDRWYAMGRYPDKTYLKYENHLTNTSITDYELAATPDWDGAEAAIRKNDWVLDRCLITSHSGTTINYSSKGTSTNATNNFGYFIQNDLRTLTSFGEWYFNGSKLYVYFGVKNPADFTVKIPAVANLLYNYGYDYITVNGIQFTGSVGSAVYLLQYADYNIIQNCTVNFSGENSIKLINVRNGIFDSNNINHSAASGIWEDTSSKNSLTNNTILNSGMLLGASLIGTQGVGIYSNYSDDIYMQYNQIDSSSYNGIFFNGNRTKVKNNFINNSLLLFNDGGGIYTSNRIWKSILIEGNIVLNSYGNTDGTADATREYGDGIFCDSQNNYITVTNNTVAFCRQNGLVFADAQYDTITNNTSFNNVVQIKYQDFLSVSTSANNYMRNNIFFAKAGTQKTLKVGLPYSLTDPFVNADANYYLRPSDDNAHFVWWVNETGWTDKTFSQWKIQSGQDANSFGSPIALTDTSKIDFYYNLTRADKVITLSQPMIDAKGTKYASSITLLPYASAVLMVDPNPAQPTVPEYVSSSVENSAPATLVMNYSLSLANIVPPASAFSIRVNSVARNVNSVSISDKKVILTLASLVVSSDIVTVAYTVPQTNQLQSTTHWWAFSSGIRPVSNNVDDDEAIPEYVSSSIEDTSPALLEMVYNQTLANIIPPASAFSVKVNNVARSVSSVAISESKVLLTLLSPVVYGDLVTVAYTVPATNQLQSVSRWWAYSSGTQPVTNNVDDAIPVYISSSIEDASPALLEMIYSQTLANIIPPASAFSVKVNSVARNVASVSISDRKVLLTLASQVVNGDIVTVAYTIPSTNQLQSTSRWWAYSSGIQAVTNNVEGDPHPVYISSSIENSTPAILEMNYNLPLYDIIPYTSAFSVKVNSISRSVNSVAISGSKVLLTLSSQVVDGDVVTVAYTVPASNQLQSVTRYWAFSISAKPVTNNVTIDPHPVYVSSSVENATPAILEMNYNLPLYDILIPPASAFSVLINSVARSVNSVAISGSKVILTLASQVYYGDVVTVAYTIPASDQLQSVARYWANSISAKPVINNVGSSGTKGGDFTDELKTGSNPDPAESEDLSLINKTGDITIYPNPVEEYMNVLVNKEFPGIQIIRIYDLSGRVMLERELTPGNNTIQIPEDLAAGIYIAKIIQGPFTVLTKKLILK